MANDFRNSRNQINFPEQGQYPYLDTEPLERVHAEYCASAVADDNVKEPMVPPALTEVRQLVL